MADTAEFRPTDEPDGRFVLKLRDKPVSGKKFHFYRDCAMSGIGSIDASLFGEGSDYEFVELDDRLIHLLALQPCSFCERRATLIDHRDLIEQVIMAEDPNNSSAAGLTDRILEALEDRGFRIRQARKQ